MTFWPCVGSKLSSLLPDKLVYILYLHDTVYNVNQFVVAPRRNTPMTHSFQECIAPPKHLWRVGQMKICVVMEIVNSYISFSDPQAEYRSVR